MLDIKMTNDEDKTMISLEGRLDTVSAPSLEAKMDEIPASTNEVYLDFEKLEYISSAGLRVILKLQKMMNKTGKMTISHVNDTIKEIFEVTGFSDILSIE